MSVQSVVVFSFADLVRGLWGWFRFGLDPLCLFDEPLEGPSSDGRVAIPDVFVLDQVFDVVQEFQGAWWNVHRWLTPQDCKWTCEDPFVRDGVEPASSGSVFLGRPEPVGVDHDVVVILFVIGVVWS